GLQTYIVNGIRTSKKNHGKASMYQSSALLQLEAYHHEHKNMQRIKEAEWAYMSHNIFSDVIRNSIAVFMVELLLKNCKHPEENIDLFHFCEDAFLHLDQCSNKTAANFPLYFALQLSQFFGFSIDMPSSAKLQSKDLYLDLQAGSFEMEQPVHTYFLEKADALLIAELLKVRVPDELDQISMNQNSRRALLQKLML